MTYGKMAAVFLFGVFIAAGAADAPAMGRRPPEPPPSVIPDADAGPRVLTLEEAYRLSLLRSETLAIENADIEQAWALFLQSAGEAIGDGRFVFQHFRQEPQGTVSDSGATATATRSERRTRQFVFTQPLFQGFRHFGALQAARQLKEGRIHERDRFRQLLFLDVARSFYSVLLYQKETAILQDILELFRRRIGELEERQEIGKSRPSEAVTSRARMKAIEADLASLRRTLAMEKRVLEFLTGISMEGRALEDDTIVPPPPDELGGYLSRAPLRHDVLAAERTLKAAGHNIVIAQSDLWPDIALTNNLYEKREGFQSGIDWDLLVTIDIPLFTGGETSGAIMEAVTERKKAELVYYRALRLAEMEIKQAYDAWSWSLEETRALEDALQAAEENYQLQNEEYERSLVNNLDVLQSLETLNDARIESADAEYRQKINYWQLQVAAGRCCESVGSLD